MDSLRKNKTWELVDHPAGQKLRELQMAVQDKRREIEGVMQQESLLKKEFDMKELGEAKKILGMEIVRDRSRKILRVSQSGYVSKILNNFRIDNGKSVQMPLGGHFKLSLKDCPCFVDSDSAKEPDKVGRSWLRYFSTRDVFAVKEAIWLRGLLEELGVEPLTPFVAR
ncbi:retrovirus-related pol polyprotein from transposon TNT 1-94 [Tanacetum coccineum]